MNGKKPDENNKIKSFLNPIKNTVGNSFEKSINAGKNTINKMIDSVKSIPEYEERLVKSGKECVDKFLENPTDTIRTSLTEKGKKICSDFTKEQTVSYSEVNKKINVSNAPSILAKSFVSNVLEGLKGGSVKLYNKISSLKDLPKKKDAYTDKEDQAVVNPDYDPSVYANSMNCAYCTATYELRKRGYDVEAAPANALTYNTADEILSWYKNPEVYTFYNTVKDGNYGSDKTVSDMKKEMLKYGEGARGQYIVYWSEGGGHSMVWEVKNNEVIIKDCQTNRTVDIEEYMPMVGEGLFFRTDNLELNDKITKAVRQRTKRIM
ncbi:MAG: toxin glutamine deamidase domain-containing protein [Phocaeicola sp.]